MNNLTRMFNLKLEEIESSKFISLAILPFLKKEPNIFHIEFDLLCDEKLILTFISNAPLEFDLPLLQQAFTDSGIELYTIYKTNNNHLKLLNLTTNHCINITSDPKQFSQLLFVIFPCWEDILNHDYHGNPKNLTNEDFKFFISDTLESLLDYFQMPNPNPLWCWA